MSKELDQLTDAELSEVFAVEVAGLTSRRWHIMSRGYFFRPLARGYTALPEEAGVFDEEYAKDYERTSHGDCKAVVAPTPPFTTSADAVLPFLEAWKPDGPDDADDEPRIIVSRSPDRYKFEIGTDQWDYEFYYTASAGTFARAACIALIRAKRAEKGQP